MWDAEQMEALRKAYNYDHPASKDIAKGPPEKVWAELKKRFHKDCQDMDACIVHSLIKNASAPMTWSSNPTEWLSSVDIEKVQDNYMSRVPEYYFAGAVPIDFALESQTGRCLVSALCSMDIREIHKKGHTMIGIIFNTDPHDKPGEHWVAAFCDIRPELDQPYMAYFDSYAQHPEEEIVDLMNAWKDKWDATGNHKKPMELIYNKVKHQFKDTECGVYCIYFIHCSIFGVPMSHRIPDDVMNMMRNFFFKMPKSSK